MKTKQKVPVQTLSIRIPTEMKPLIKQQAKSFGLTMSRYIQRLVSEGSFRRELVDPVQNLEESQKPWVKKLSISLPSELKPLVKERAAQQDLTVSQHIRRLVDYEINVEPLKV